MPSTLVYSDFSGGLPSGWSTTLTVTNGLVGGFGVVAFADTSEVVTTLAPHATGAASIGADGYRRLSLAMTVFPPFIPAGNSIPTNGVQRYGYAMLSSPTTAASIRCGVHTVVTAGVRTARLACWVYGPTAGTAATFTALGTAVNLPTTATSITVTAILTYTSESIGVELSSTYAGLTGPANVNLNGPLIRTAFDLATLSDLRLADFRFRLGRSGTDVSVNFGSRSTSFVFDAVAVTDLVQGATLVPVPATAPNPSAPPPYSVPAMALPVAAAEPTLVLASALSGSSENDAGAETLTVHPSYTLQVADGYQTTEHPYDAGYFASSSQTSKRRRSWGFQWRALNATQFTTLLALAVAVEGKRTSFLWTDPETAEVIRLRFLADLQYQQIAGTGASAVYAASASVEEVHA